MKFKAVLLAFSVAITLVGCSNDNRVQLADETIVYGRGTALDRAVLIKSILFLKDMNSKIYHNDKETYIEFKKEYYSTVDFKKVISIRTETFKIY